MTGGTAFGSGVRFISRFVPGNDLAAAEFWGVDGAGLVKRLVGSAAWADVTLDDAISADFGEVNAVTLNGKYYLAYNSAVNRMHVFDPADGKVRRSGVANGGTGPTTAILGAGAITDTRTYKVQFMVQSGGVSIRQSNLTAASGAQAYAAQNGTITRPTTPSTEGITHWRVFAASTDGAYRLLVDNIAIGTTTATDNFAALTGDPPSDSGAYTPFPSARYLTADDTRLVGTGAWETAAGEGMVPTTRRVWWTSRLGSSDIGDDERVSNVTGGIKGYDDVEESTTGVSPTIQGSFIVYSYESQWKFVQTGDSDAPYQRFRVTGGEGCIQHKTIVTAVDEDGDPAVYWLSRNGPMRTGKNGQQYLNRDLADTWARVNLDATTTVAHAVYHSVLRQVWFWVAVDGANTPTLKLVFDTRLGRLVVGEGVRGGWSLHDGHSAKAYCSTMGASALAASMAKSLKPYIGYTTGEVVWRCDTTDGADNGNSFQSYVESRPFAPWGIGKIGGIKGEAVIIGNPTVAAIHVVVIRDEKAETIDSSIILVDYSDGGLAVRVFPKIGLSIVEANSFRIRIGDDVDPPSLPQWNLDAFVMEPVAEGKR